MSSNTDIKQLTEELQFGDVTSGDYTSIEIDGTTKASGDATCYDDLGGQLFAQRVDVASGKLDFDYFNAGVTFAANAEYPGNPAVVSAQTRHAMYHGPGALAHPHIHYRQTVATTDIPNWLLAYKIIPLSSISTIETGFTNFTLSKYTGTNVFPNAVGRSQLVAFPDIDISSLGISSEIHMVLFRDTTNASGLFAGADPVSGGVTVTYLDAHVKFDMLGSRSEYTK